MPPALSVRSPLKVEAAPPNALKQRVLSVLVALPLFLAALFYLPNRWWGVLMAALLLIGGDEWSRLARFSRLMHLLFLAVLAAACAILMMRPTHNGEQWIYWASLAFWCLVVPAWLRFKWRPNSAALAAAGILVLLPAWLALTRLQLPPLQLAVLLAVIWVADTAAFFVGKRYGRHKLALKISPGKTWEGVLGALVAVMLYAWAVAPILRGLDGAMMTIMGVFLAMTVLGIIGDLFESWLKRVAEVKDSGRLLPGHGGLLDRIDGITAALPFAALCYANGLS